MTTKITYLLIALLLVVSSKFLYAQNSTIVPGNIIVMLHSEEASNLLIAGLSHVNGVKTNVHLKATLSKKMHIYLLEFDHLSVDHELMLRTLLSNPLVKTAQLNHTIGYRNTPNDSLFSQQWSMYNTGQTGGTPGVDIDALNAWNITTGGLSAQGDTIVVAIVDGGFDLNHEDLNFWINRHEIPNNGIDDDNNGYIDDYYGWNTENQSDSFSIETHGTHVCGIAGAKGNNNKGIAGVNWNVKIMPVAASTVANVISAYGYIIEQRRQYNQTNGAKGAFVVATNSSFGLDTTQPSAAPMWCAMYDSLGSVGVLSAAATTNNNFNVDSVGDIPTACPSNWLVTVTNTTDTDAKATAGFGATTIDLGAPGTSIISTHPSNTYGVMSGTSVSSPQVAGAIALMYSVGCYQFMEDYKKEPAGIALMIKDSLLQAVDKTASLQGITVSGGRLNLYKAVNALLKRYPNDHCNILERTNPAFEIINTYPNPTSNLLNIVFNSVENCATVQATIFNLFGQKLTTTSIANNSEGLHNFTIEMGTLKGGVYLLQLCSCNNNTTNVIKVTVY